MIVGKDHLVDERLPDKSQDKVFHFADVAQSVHVGLAYLALDLERRQEASPDRFARLSGERPRFVAILKPMWARSGVGSRTRCGGV